MLTELQLRNFRCFDALRVEFASGFNFLLGANGQGKTSILEGACVLLRLQSQRSTTLAPLIRLGEKSLADGRDGKRTRARISLQRVAAEAVVRWRRTEERGGIFAARAGGLAREYGHRDGARRFGISATLSRFSRDADRAALSVDVARVRAGLAFAQRAPEIAARRSRANSRPTMRHCSNTAQISRPCARRWW